MFTRKKMSFTDAFLSLRLFEGSILRKCIFSKINPLELTQLLELTQFGEVSVVSFDVCLFSQRCVTEKIENGFY